MFIFVIILSWYPVPVPSPPTPPPKAKTTTVNSSIRCRKFFFFFVKVAVEKQEPAFDGVLLFYFSLSLSPSDFSSSSDMIITPGRPTHFKGLGMISVFLVLVLLNVILVGVCHGSTNPLDQAALVALYKGFRPNSLSWNTGSSLCDQINSGVSCDGSGKVTSMSADSPLFFPFANPSLRLNPPLLFQILLYFQFDHGH